MATQYGRPTPDRDALFRDVVAVLRETRGGVAQHRMAQVLLQRDATGPSLVALVDGGDRAVFFNPLSRTLEAFPFDAGGVREGDAAVLSRRLTDPTAWVESHGRRATWVHPHYRAVCGLDG